MTNPFEIEYDADRCIVVWAAQVHHSVTLPDERALSQLVEDNRFVVYNFGATRVIGTRWLRLVQRLSIVADSMGKEIAVVGLTAMLLEKADLVAIKQDLHLYDSLETMPAR
jgi:hypothetical protein